MTLSTFNLGKYGTKVKQVMQDVLVSTVGQPVMEWRYLEATKEVLRLPEHDSIEELSAPEYVKLARFSS